MLKLEINDCIAYDTETTGLDVRQDKMFAFSLGYPNGETSVHRLDGSAARVSISSQKLASVWQASDCSKVMHNAKFDLYMTVSVLGWGILTSPIHDTMIQAKLVYGGHHSYGLKDLAWELAGVPKDDEKEVEKCAAEFGGYSRVPEAVMDKYQHRDALRTILLHRFFYPKIAADPKLLAVYENELDLIKCTMEIESRGIMIDPNSCTSLIQQVKSDIDALQSDIEQVTGRRLNLNKGEHVKWLLYTYAELPVLQRTAKTKEPSTEKEVLMALKRQHPHPALDYVLKFRSWSRAITYLKSYIKFADDDSIIHPHLNTYGAETGRESCSQPNLQNVAKTGVLLNPFAVPARRVFRPRPRHVFYAVDFAGIEFRLAVFYAKDELLTTAMREGGDPHALAAEVFFGEQFLSADPVMKKTLRNAAKNMNFAMIYGAGLGTIAAGLNMTVEQATPGFQKYRTTFPGLVRLMTTITEQGKREGFVTTVFGRPLKVPKGEAFVATNYLIQGTAADVLKRAQTRVHHYLKQRTDGAVHILLPIHDELVIEFPRNFLSYRHEIFKNINALMTDFPEINIPLPVEIACATNNWEEKKDCTKEVLYGG